MFLVVVPLRDDAAAVELTRERIETLAESRLRAARLYTETQIVPYLRIGVQVVGPAFSFSVHYNKQLHDPVSDTSFASTTWTNDRTGTHGGGAGYILQVLSEAVDLFVLEYLRVNEDACGNP